MVSALVGATVLVALAAFVRVRAAPAAAADLKPRPDALEYGVAARSLVEHGEYALPIGETRYPPRYPPGFALLSAPFVAAAGGDPSAVRDAAFVFGLLGVLITFALGIVAAGILGGWVAGAVVALSPLAVEQSALAMSETASAMLVGGALLAAALALWRREPDATRSGMLWLAGVAVAASATLRYTNLAPWLPILLFFGTRHAFAPTTSRLRALAAVVLPVVSVLGALAVFHYTRFGHPLHDGYRFWVPEVYENRGLVLSARYVTQGIPGYWEHGHLSVYGAELTGRGGLYSIVAAALAGLGLLRFLFLSGRCPVARWLALASLTMLPAMVLFHLVYFWQDPRFLVSLLPLLAVLAGSGAEAIRALVAGRDPTRTRTAASVTVGVLALAATVLAPARTLSPTVFPDHRRAPPPSLLDRLPTLDAELERDSIVIVDFPVTLAVPALGDRREIIVADRDRTDPHLNRIARHGLVSLDGDVPSIRALAAGEFLDEETFAHVVRFAHEGRPVYLITTAGEVPALAAVRELGRRCRMVEQFARPPFTVHRAE